MAARSPSCTRSQSVSVSPHSTSPIEHPRASSTSAAIVRPARASPTTMSYGPVESFERPAARQRRLGAAQDRAADRLEVDDLGELERKAAGQSGERSHTVVHTHSKTVINNNTTRKERVRELAGFGHGADRLKQSQTVRTLRS